MKTYDCIGRYHWSDKQNIPLFQYRFETEPQAGDVIELMDDEIEETTLSCTRWEINCRKFVRGKMVLVLQPEEGTNGLVPA